MKINKKSINELAALSMIDDYDFFFENLKAEDPDEDQREIAERIALIMKRECGIRCPTSQLVDFLLLASHNHKEVEL